MFSCHCWCRRRFSACMPVCVAEPSQLTFRQFRLCYGPGPCSESMETFCSFLCSCLFDGLPRLLRPGPGSVNQDGSHRSLACKRCSCPAHSMATWYLMVLTCDPRILMCTAAYGKQGFVRWFAWRSAPLQVVMQTRTVTLSCGGQVRHQSPDSPGRR